MSVTEESVDAILKRSGSNLAFALARLPKPIRRDMRVFYAFCRIVDDIADEPGPSAAEKETALGHWEKILTHTALPRTEVEREVSLLKTKLGNPAEEWLGIIEGVRMDLQPRRYENWEALREYCYRVASLVGLVSTRIFGCTRAESRAYAEHLGYALQLTNILRDVRQDWENGQRIYLPWDVLTAHGLNAETLAAAAAAQDPKFVAMMTTLADMADSHYTAAVRNLTPPDRPKLRAAEAMRGIYSRVLQKMRLGNFQVWETRYRLSFLHKLWVLCRA